MIGPSPENIARLDADWDADARAYAEAKERALDDFDRDLCGRDDTEHRLERLEATEETRRRDASTQARCERLGIIVARRMPVIHQRRCGRTGR